ncbi:hypothetical protein OF117_13325 [Geodermatophilus sp. YIM 151500]|uniref:hypothetical protein n=1 Tax=Geodermatophilus sp. YIM 151500 TaxID=2984531 RepID=UPI0021E4391D|nr:hypothetical protein [Geodermatophilus sp. YIM 151500]MCV2490344.1 hypothetical protein [Geodermatophilus sp. YIM 151500]
MFVFAAAVPALLVVVVGYVVGYAVAERAVGLLEAAFGTTLPPAAPEVVGWATGLVLLAAVVRLLVVRPAWLRRALGRGPGGGPDGTPGGHQDRGHQK